MFTQRRPVGPQGIDSLARAQRVIRAVMNDLSGHPNWRDPFKRVTVHADVTRCVSSMMRTGETNDEALKAGALQAVRLRSQ